MVAFLSQLLLAIRSRLTRRARLEAENLLLRQQLIVLRRKSPTRVRLEHRSLAVGMAVSAVPVAPGRDHHRPAGDRASLAPTWFPRLLALEIPKSLKQLSAGIWSGVAGHRRKVGRLSCAITQPASLRWTCSWYAPSRSSCSDLVILPHARRRLVTLSVTSIRPPSGLQVM